MSAMAGNFTAWSGAMGMKDCPECTFTGAGKAAFEDRGRYLRTKAAGNAKNPCKIGIFPVQSDMVKG